MHDIAGCRAVVIDQDAGDRLINALRSDVPWELQPKVWDYVENPKADGYRAKHLVAIVDGLRVEIQVRTTLQHAWAELVESLDRDLGLRAKFGDTEPVLASALRDASDAVAAYERGELDVAATIGRLYAPLIVARLKR
jgi:ppGpp synthetase/RelA/SpoT-type nucleotidyltranferase